MKTTVKSEWTWWVFDHENRVVRAFLPARAALKMVRGVAGWRRARVEGGVNPFRKDTILNL